MKLQTCFSLTLFFITRQRRFIFCQGSRSSWGGREHSSLSSPLLVFSYCYSWFEGNVTSCILYMLTWMNLSQFKVLSDCLLQTVGTEKMSPALTFLPTLVNFYLLEKIDTKIIATTQNHNKYYKTIVQKSRHVKPTSYQRGRCQIVEILKSWHLN